MGSDNGMASEIKDASEDVQAGAKATGNKMKNPNRDIDTEYDKERTKENLD
jgi:hypothetical protein